MAEMSDDFPMMMEQEVDPRHGGVNPNVPAIGVAFGLYPMKDQHLSDKAGHDVYVDVEHVRIAVPGDRNSLYFQPAQDQHRKRFPRAYAAYKNRETAPSVGLPIDQCPFVSRAQALTLKAANIPTVEALAEVHEGHVDRLGSNGRELREKARAFLAAAKDTASATSAAKDKKQLQDQIEALQAQINALTGVKPAPASEAPAADDAAAAARKPRAKAKAA